MAIWAISFMLIAKSNDFDIRYMGTKPIWWDSTTQFKDPNEYRDYGFIFDYKPKTLSKEVMFKRYGDISVVQGTPIATAFNFNRPFTGRVSIGLNFRKSLIGIERNRLFEVGAYDLSILCASSVLLNGKEGYEGKSILSIDVNTSIKELVSINMPLIDLSDAGLSKTLSFDVEDCHGLVFREISTSLIAVDRGKFISHVIYRRIDRIEFDVPIEEENSL